MSMSVSMFMFMSGWTSVGRAETSRAQVERMVKMMDLRENISAITPEISFLFR